MAKIIFELDLDLESRTLMEAATRVANNVVALTQSLQVDVVLPENDEQLVSHETFMKEHNACIILEAGPRRDVGSELADATQNVTLRILMQPGSISKRSIMADSGFGEQSRVEMQGDKIVAVDSHKPMGVPDGQARH